MTVEDRLRDALHAEADRVDDRHEREAWDVIQSEVVRRRAFRTARGVGIVVLAAAAVVAVALAVVPNRLDQPLDVGPADDRRVPITPTTVPVTSDDAQDIFAGIWPFTSAEEVEAYEADPGVGMFFDPEQTALEFAREYLGMPDPEPASGFVVVDDPRRGAIAVRPRPGAPMLTGITLSRIGDDGPYFVTGAQSEDIVVRHPTTPSTVGNPVVISGEGTAFEGTIQAEVRQDGQTFGDRLGRTFFTAGSSGEMAGFGGDLTYDPPTTPAGAVVLWTESAEDGSVLEATVVRVRFDPASLDGALTRFSVFFHRGERELVEVAREVPKTTSVLRAALESLFAGPTQDEQDAGIGSLFNESTADLLRDVALRADGTAVVDIHREVPIANAATASRAFFAEMNATVFQFSTVQRIEYRLRGSCDAFWEWQQVGGCDIVER